MNTLTVLRGPTDAANYRIKVGRYGDRWYTDPLATDAIAEASDWSGPSWSIVKGAAGKDWSFVTNKRNAHTPRAELERIAGLEPEQRAQAFNAINKNGLTQAGGRGTIVHLWAEDLLAGGSPRELSDIDLMTRGIPAASLVEALTYRDAIVAFFDTYQPEVIAAEYVALHRTLNGVGYGCTPDVVARINGQVLGVDWKTRGIDSDHGAYPEEAAQIAAGARAEYMIVAGDDGNPIRAAVPEMDGGIVVSIRPDGCRIYPVDLDQAFEHTQAMHAFWVARRTEKVAIGKPWPPKIAPSHLEAAPGVEPTNGPAPATPGPVVDDFHIVVSDGRRGSVTVPTSRTWIHNRVRELVDIHGAEQVLRQQWPQGVPPLTDTTHTVEQLTQLFHMVRRVETEVSAPFDPEPQPTYIPEPESKDITESLLEPLDDGAFLDPPEIEALKQRMLALPDTRHIQLADISREANAAGRPISVTAKPCVRRWEIARALVLWAESPHNLTYLEMAVTVHATVDQIKTGADTIGALISLYTIEQAVQLADTFQPE